MGYYVKPLPGNKKRPWKLQVQSEAGGVRKIVDIAPDKLGDHHFAPGMTLEEARARAALLNKDSEIKRHAARRANIGKRLEREAVATALSFPDEAEFLAWAQETSRGFAVKANKFNSHWHCTKKIIATLGLKPEEFGEKKLVIYRWFQENQLSYSYLVKVLRLLNLYAKFHAKKYRVFVEQVPTPKGYNKSDIEDAYHEKNPKGRAAMPLTHGQLEKARESFEVPHYNWIYLSLWLGLRPSEVESLRSETSYKVETLNGAKVLWVYQPKLKKLPREQRWKPIPLVEPEQKRVLDLIEAKNFTRPLAKTMANHLGEGFNRYSGRKGFEATMRDRGYSLEDVSQWLGHQSIERTWRNYVNKRAVRWKKSA